MSEPESSAAGPPAAANSHPRLELREQDICDPENSTVVGNEPRRSDTPVEDGSALGSSHAEPRIEIRAGESRLDLRVVEIAGRNSEVIVVDQDPVSSRRAAPERIPAIPEASLGPREDSVAVRPPMRTVAHDESQQRPELVTSAEDAARCAEKDAGSGDSNTQDDHPADEAEDDRARESAHVANSVLFPGPSAPVQRSRDGDPAPGQSNNEPEMGPPLDPDSDDLAGTSSVLPPEEAAKAKSLQEYRALKRKLSQQILWKLYDDKGTPLAMMDDKDREKEQRRLAARQAAEATPVQRWTKNRGPSFKISLGGQFMSMMGKDKGLAQSEADSKLETVCELGVTDVLGIKQQDESAPESTPATAPASGPPGRAWEAQSVAPLAIRRGPGGAKPSAGYSTPSRMSAVQGAADSSAARPSRLAQVTRGPTIAPVPPLGPEGGPGGGTAGGKGGDVSEKRTGTAEDTPEDDMDHDAWEMMMYKRRTIWGRVHHFVESIVEHQDFEMFVILLIFANCIVLAMYRPLEPALSPWNKNLEFAELIFNLVFTGEVILRLLYHEGARNYLRHPWNVFDLVMVLAGYTSFLPQSDSTGNMSALRALRALRAMRPLRTVTRFQSLKVVVVSFMDSVPMLVQVVLLMFFIMMLFAISGLSLFQEAFHRQCYDPVSMEFEVAYGPSPDEFGCGGTRSCPESHPVCGYKSTGRGQVMAGFDNLGTSTLSVFQVITLGGWSFMMYRVVDNTSWAFSLWFVVLVLFGAYFAVNLFLAVLKLKFGKAQQTFTEKLRQKAKKKKQSNITKAFGFVKRNINKVVERRKEKALGLGMDIEKSGSSFGSEGSFATSNSKASLSEAEAKVLRQARLQHQIEIEPKKSKRLWLHFRLWNIKVTDHPRFTTFFFGLIIINTILMGTEHYGMSAAFSRVLDICNIVLTALFTVEVVMKIIGLTIWVFLEDKFNNFDLFIVFMSWLDIFILSGGGLSSLRALRTLRVLKSLRVLRVFKMFKYLQSLKKIVDVIMQSTGTFFSVGVLITLFMLVFTIIGLHVLGSIVIPPDAQTTANYNSFIEALRTTFQLLTMENWEIIMFTYVDQIGWGAVAFVVSWVILGKYIFLTLFLAVIMEAFESKYDIQATKELKFLGRRRNKRQKRAAKAAEAARQRELSAGNAAPKEPSAPSGRTSPPIKDAPAPGRALSQPRQVSGGESSEKTGGTGQKRRTQSLGRSGQVAPAPMSQRGGASAASDGPQRIMTKSADRENPTGEHAHDRNKASSMGRSKGDETGASSRERRDIGRGGEPDGSQHTLGPPRRRIKGASVTFAEEHQEAPTRSGRSVTFGEQAGMRPRAMPMIAEMRPAIKTSRGASASSGRGEQSDREAGRGGGGRARGGAARQKPAAPVGFGSSARKPVAEAVERRTLYGGASGPVAESTESAERRTVPRGRDHSAEGAGREESDCDMDRRAFPRRGPVGEGVEGTSGPRSSLEPMTRVVKQSGERVSRVGFRVADQKESSTGSGVEKELSRRNSEFSMISGDADSVSVVSDLQDLMDLQEEALDMYDDWGVESSAGSKPESSVSMGRSAAAVAKEMYGKKKKKTVLKHQVYEGKAFGVLGTESAFRTLCYRIAMSKWLDKLMSVIIIVNCVMMMLEKPSLEEEGDMYAVLYWSDVVFTGIFTIEMLLKMTAFTVKQYMSHLPNMIDSLIVAGSILTFGLEAVVTDLRIVKGLRVLRAIKPLRAITRSNGMQIVLRSILLSMAAMGNVSLILGLFFIVFGILGVQLFAGRLYSCNDTSVEDKSECVGEFLSTTPPTDGQIIEREWTNEFFHFNHLGAALITLFIFSTQDGYTDTLDAVLASRGIDKQPRLGSNNWMVLYFILFIFVVAFCLMNMYVGVVFFQFSRIKLLSQVGTAFFSKEQHQWVEMNKILARLKPEGKPRPRGKFGRLCRRIVLWPKFETLIMILIILNVILMGIEYHNQPAGKTYVEEMINYTVTLIFFVEVIIRSSAWTWRIYWKSKWHRFDFIISMASLVDAAVSIFLAGTVDIGTVKVFRVLRLSRMMRLIKRVRGLNDLFTTLVVSLPALWNVGAVLFLIFFIYAYVGVLMFGTVKRGVFLNEHANFEDFGRALLLLFRAATNDEWSSLLKDMMVAPPDCSHKEGNCGSVFAMFYMGSFMLLVSTIMINLFPTVIIENFESTMQREEWSVHPSVLEEFIILWGHYDDGSGTIDPKQLEELLIDLGPPLGVRRGATSKELIDFVSNVDIPLTVEGRVSFGSVIYELVRRVCEVKVPEGEVTLQLNRIYKRIFANAEFGGEHDNFRMFMVVKRVQRRWRNIFKHKAYSMRRSVKASRSVVPAAADVMALDKATISKPGGAVDGVRYKLSQKQVRAILDSDLGTVLGDVIGSGWFSRNHRAGFHDDMSSQ